MADALNRATMPFTKKPPEPRRIIMPMPPSAPLHDDRAHPISVKFATSGTVSGAELKPLGQPVRKQPSLSMPCGSVESDPAPLLGVSGCELKPSRYCSRPEKPSEKSYISSPDS